jgi:hypothetical protein
MADRILKTQKDSAIKRSKHGVGKDMGGTLYMHMAYENRLPNQAALRHGKAKLKKHYPGFKYNVVKQQPNGRMSFFNSPDFDTAHEPTAGEYVTVDGDQVAKRNEKKIWHHKWTFVDDDYAGFDVDKSFNRSKAWLQIPNINFNVIGHKHIWEKDYVPRIPAI